MVGNGPRGSRSCVPGVTPQCWELTWENPPAVVLSVGRPGLPCLERGPGGASQPAS